MNVIGVTNELEITLVGHSRIKLRVPVRSVVIPAYSMIYTVKASSFVPISDKVASVSSYSIVNKSLVVGSTSF